MLNKTLYESLFKRNSDTNGNKEFLEQVTRNHPYFSAAQFYLLLQTDPASASFTKQAARTALFFNNPHWLNFQLQQKKEHGEETIVTSEFEKLPIENTDNSDTEGVMEKEILPMKIELKIPAENDTNDALLFEPLHLVDYFASQGIKLAEDVQQTDKLGKQLKSFTEWLKTMKKIHTGTTEQASLITVNIPEQSETSIQILAEKSNTENEILTESMAAIFAKQGKPGKAAELYQKLSLLNPSKSAYFASKIENLKGS